MATTNAASAAASPSDSTGDPSPSPTDDKKRKRDDEESLSANATPAVATTAIDNDKNNDDAAVTAAATDKAAAATTDTPTTAVATVNNTAKTNTTKTTARKRRKKKTAPPSFYAVRPGSVVKGPAIFYNWDDLKMFFDYVEGSKPSNGTGKNRPLTYEVFRRLEDAVAYIKPTLGDDINYDDDSSSPTLPRRFQRWEERFNELVKYKEVHGSCNVKSGKFATPEEKSLALWVMRQREKIIKKDATLTADQRQRLLRLGTSSASSSTTTAPVAAEEATPPEPPAKKQRRTATPTIKFKHESPGRIRQWEEKFKWLQTFHREHGHCHVGRSKARVEHRPLEAWVQRQKLKLRKKAGRGNDGGGMTKDQRLRLGALLGLAPEIDDESEMGNDKQGMDSENDHDGGGSDSEKDEDNEDDEDDAGNDGDDEKEHVGGVGVEEEALTLAGMAHFTRRRVQWEEKFNRLQEFHKEHGHVDVQDGMCDDPKLRPLVHWVKQQRQKLWEYNAGDGDTEIEDNINNKKHWRGNNGLALDQRQQLLQLGLTPMAPGDHPDETANTAAGTSAASGEDDVDLGAHSDLMLSGRDRRWEKNFELLQMFKEEHGDCNVISVKGDPATTHLYSLSTWVKNQKRKVQDEGSNLSADQRQRLLDLGILEKNSAVRSKLTEQRRLEVWDQRLELLRKFKDEFGHCNVSFKLAKDKNYKTLVYWCRRQREFMNKDSAHLSPVQKQRLLDLGFGKSEAAGQRLFDIAFEKRFEELKEYKEEHGNLDVPANTPLHKWMTKMRRYYEDMQQGKEGGVLKLEHVGALVSAGFSFTTAKARPRKLKDAIGDYIEFVKKHGRFPGRHASDSMEGRLFSQAQKWRHRRRLMQEGVTEHHGYGKKVALPQELIEKLDTINFRWALNEKLAKSRPSRRQVPWETKFELLKEYMDANDGNEPQNRHPGLGRYVMEQRKQYRNMVRGINTNLTLERFRKLSEIGFRFIAKKPGGAFRTYKSVDDGAFFDEDGKLQQQHDDSFDEDDGVVGEDAGYHSRDEVQDMNNVVGFHHDTNHAANPHHSNPGGTLYGFY